MEAWPVRGVYHEPGNLEKRKTNDDDIADSETLYDARYDVNASLVDSHWFRKRKWYQCIKYSIMVCIYQGEGWERRMATVAFLVGHTLLGTLKKEPRIPYICSFQALKMFALSFSTGYICFSIETGSTADLDYLLTRIAIRVKPRCDPDS